jgi:hypothetical protein
MRPDAVRPRWVHGRRHGWGHQPEAAQVGPAAAGGRGQAQYQRVRGVVCTPVEPLAQRLEGVAYRHHSNA